MKKSLLLAAAALVFASASAQAGNSFSFNVNGQKVRIDIPRNCASLNCLNISAPGLNFNKKDDDDEPAPAKTAEPAKITPAPVAAAAPAPTTSAAVAAAPAPAPVASAPVIASSAIVPTSPPAPVAQPTTVVSGHPFPSADPVPQVTPAPTNTVVAAASPVETPKAAAAPVANSPIGIWVTEKNEGKVRIEYCGQNLCGDEINAKTNLDGEKVLIGMKPAGEGKWSGRIHDIRGGGTYDSTITLKSNDKLRVQGCAFGGMFCGGQTWTRG